MIRCGSLWSGYFTVSDGKCITFQSNFVGGTEKDIDILNTEFDTIIQSVTWGETAKSPKNDTSTYSDELGFSITTPNETLKVDEKQDTFFYAVSADEKYYIEVYDAEQYLPRINFEGITNLSGASEEQKNKFFEAVKNMVANSQSPNNMVTEPMSELVTINDVDYVKSQLAFLAGEDMIIWSGYFTVADGKCIDFQSAFVGGTENDVDRLNTEFDTIMQTVLWGDAAKSAAASIQAVDTQEKDTGIWDKINHIELPFWIF